MSIETMLHDEIKAELEELKRVEVGTEKHKAMVDSLTKLVDRAIEMEKIGVESQDKEDTREIDVELKRQEMAEERKDRWIKNGIAVLSVVVPTAVTVWGTIKSIEFEKEGTITTIMGRGFIQKLLPKK